MELPVTLWMKVVVPKMGKLLRGEQTLPRNVPCQATLLSPLAALPLYLQLGFHRLASNSSYLMSVSPVSQFKIRTANNLTPLSF